MFESLSFEYFNLAEGIFWIVFGLLSLLAYFKIKKPYTTLALFSSFVLITFGASDFLEVAYGSFLTHGMEWLLIWKIIDVIGLIAIVPWYLFLRINE
ncbi:MAG: hypothetical protein ACI9H6_000146 [Patiriisocius sp.]|jgi:hypothetical protein